MATPVMLDMCERCNKREATEVHHKDGNHDNNAPENLMNVCGFCQAKLHNIMPNLSEAKVQYENLKDLENTRIRIENRVRGLKKKWGISTELIEGELKTVKGLERKVERRLIETVKDKKILGWITEIRGIANKTAAELIALIGDIGRFDTVSSLWHYAGLHVNEGKAPKLRKGEKIDYHPKLRALCIGIIGKNFVRLKSSYRQLYDEKKKYYEQNRDWKKGHRHNAAIRFMVKQFLKELWLKWRELERLSITSPHSQDKPKHRMKTMVHLRLPAGAGDASGSDQTATETQTTRVPPAGPKITVTMSPQNQPSVVVKTTDELRRSAGAGDVGQRTSPTPICTPRSICAVRRPSPITEPHPRDQPIFHVKTGGTVRRPVGAGDKASGSDLMVTETQTTRVPPAGLTITEAHP